MNIISGLQKYSIRRAIHHHQLENIQREGINLKLLKQRRYFKYHQLNKTTSYFLAQSNISTFLDLEYLK